MPQISSVLVLVHYTAVCIKLYNDLCTILNGCVMAQLCAVKQSIIIITIIIASVICQVGNSCNFILNLTVCMAKMIHGDTEAICNILYGLSGESLLFFFVLFLVCFLHHRIHYLYTCIHLCIPSVCERFMQSQLYKRS